MMMKTILLTGDSDKRTLAIGIIGSLVLTCLFMAILYLWKKFKLPRSKLCNAGKLLYKMFT
jgi:hypothetical protein